LNSVQNLLNRRYGDEKGGSKMLKNFSRESQSVLTKAKQIAFTLNTDKIESEHVLWALKLKTPEPFDKWMNLLKVEPEDIIKGMPDAIMNLQDAEIEQKVSVSDELKAVLKAAQHCSKAFPLSGDEGIVQPVHLIAALAANPDENFRQLLTTLGADKSKLESSVEQLLRVKVKVETPEPKSQIDQGLLRYGISLTQQAREGKLEEIYGRKQEVFELMKGMLKKRKRNALLIGYAGAGKTSVVWKFAQMIAAGEVPEQLKDVTIFQLDMARFKSELTTISAYNEFLKRFLSKLAGRDDIILFIDEIHSLFHYEFFLSRDIADILKPILEVDDFRLIGTTTFEEYRKYIEANPTLDRRFSVIRVNELPEPEVLILLKQQKADYEEYHRVQIPDETLEASVKLCRRHLRNRRLPGIALDILDEACAEVRLRAKETSAAPTIAPSNIARAISAHIGIPISTYADVDENVIDYALQNVDTRFGARGLEGALEDVLDDNIFIARGLEHDKWKNLDTIRIRLEEDQLGVEETSLIAKRVLFVENEMDVFHQLQDTMPDYQWECATTGEEVLTAIRKKEFDLILLGLNFAPEDEPPNKLGIDILKQIKNITPELTVVMLTKHTDWQDVATCFKLGAYDYIEKPMRQERLKNIMDFVLQTKIEVARSKKKDQIIQAQHEVIRKYSTEGTMLEFLLSKTD